MSKTKYGTKMIAYCALLCAIAVILGIISPRLGNDIKISLAPIAVMLAGAYFGCGAGACVGFLSNLVSYFFNSGGGAFNPALAATMALYGVLAAVFFYKKESSALKISLCVLLIQTLNSALLNTFFLSMMYGTPFLQLLLTRLPATYICCAVYIAAMCVLLKSRRKIEGMLRRSA